MAQITVARREPEQITQPRLRIAVGRRTGAGPLVTIAPIDLDAMGQTQRDEIRWWADRYLTAANRHRDTWTAYGQPLLDAIGIQDRRPFRYDEDLLVALARQVLAALDAPADQLAAAAIETGDTAGIAVAWLVAGTLAARHERTRSALR